MFEVDDYDDFVAVQSEAALRNLATRYPYDSEDHDVSLRGSTDEICERLREDIQERLAETWAKYGARKREPAGQARSARV